MPYRRETFVRGDYNNLRKVAVVRGRAKVASFKKLLKLSHFDETLLSLWSRSEKPKSEFAIAIKPNMMVFVTHKNKEAVVTDPELVEMLVDHLRALGFSQIFLCEAQNDVGRMMKNHTVAFVAKQIGYRPRGRYQIVDLTLESVPYVYKYLDRKRKLCFWKDTVGKTWRDADFRISFAKCKTHEHDWMTLSVKNVYGCFPNPNKVCRYHIQHEIFDVTARMMANFPVHFAFVDAWIGSDGFQGYKIGRPKPLHMFFAGPDPVAVDMEIFRRAGLDFRKSRILRAVVNQTANGLYPAYQVIGDQTTLFSQILPWENVSESIVQAIDILEEVYIAWGFINMKPGAEVIDYRLFPPKNFFSRMAVWMTKQLYSVFKATRFFKKLYGKG